MELVDSNWDGSTAAARPAKVPVKSDAWEWQGRVVRRKGATWSLHYPGGRGRSTSTRLLAPRPAPPSPLSEPSREPLHFQLVNYKVAQAGRGGRPDDAPPPPRRGQTGVGEPQQQQPNHSIESRKRWACVLFLSSGRDGATGRAEAAEGVVAPRGSHRARPLRGGGRGKHPPKQTCKSS